ncbi:hypothetical protein MJO28_017920 [Puccinia striiformis f. sp. tritici]|nr:hypothetical protein MJO28_017920 [Puccinia striiformis f. sp. tritici]
MIALALKRQSQQQAQQHAIKLEQQAQRHAKQMQAERASRDKAMSQLMAKVKIREAGPSFPNAGKKPVPLKTQPFPSPPISRINPSGYLNHKAATPKKSNGSTPQRTPSGQTKPAVTPKTNSPKTSPHKMISANMPESFASTREIDLAHSSGDNDEEYEEEEEDFGFVDNSMATSEPEQVEQEDENVDNNKEEELAREARCNAMMIDT